MNESKNNEKMIIGKYKIEKTIGQGTFGKVKLGIHLPTNEKVAIKILEKTKIVFNEDSERVQREITFLKKLNHINVIRIYEIIENPKSFFIIMEYASEGELFNYIVKQRRLGESEASLFFAQIINGLEYIHKNNIVHRDFKPENLLLTEKKIIKIIDFGLSNSYKTGQLLSTPCGSPCYAAPEMILGRKYSGLFVDIWSTGIILYAMVCGFLPFEDKNDDSLYKKIILCDYKIPDKPNITEDMKDLITRILCVNTKKRIKLEEIKKHRFYQLGAEQLKKINCYTTSSEKNKYDNFVINKMIEMGLNKSSIIKNLDSKKTSDETATYFLLYNKLSRNNELEEDFRKNICFQDNVGSNSGVINTMEISNKNNINININYSNQIGNINININEADKLLIKKKIPNYENKEKKQKAEIQINQSKLSQIQNFNSNSKIQRVKGKNMSTQAQNISLKDKLFLANYKNKDQIYYTTPRPFNSNEMFMITSRNKNSSNRNLAESMLDRASSRVCESEVLNTLSLNPAMVTEEKITQNTSIKPNMQTILEEKADLKKKNLVIARKLTFTKKNYVPNTPTRNKFNFNLYGSNTFKQESLNSKNSFKMRNNNCSLNLFHEKSKKKIESLKNNNKVFEKSFTDKNIMIRKNKKSKTTKNSISSNCVANISNYKTKNLLTKRNTERNRIQNKMREFSFENKENEFKCFANRKNKSYSAPKDRLDNNSEKSITKDNFFPSPKKIYQTEKCNLIQKKNIILNLTDKTNYVPPTSRNKNCYLKFDQFYSSSRSKCEGIEPKSKNLNKGSFRKEYNKSVHIPPKEGLRFSDYNSPTDFSCCTVNSIGEYLERLKEFCVKKQMKFQDLGNFEFLVSDSNGGNKIVFEFTSIELINKSTYLLKILMFSKDNKNDSELVKELLELCK